ncbi:AfsR/SARP family transcriptional regulator [Virgisporangium aurantiacum]|uniref:SARP family transcriptional regulator n=1 Tax=Virgisporangium aurantiacum TaxID=175570 RepID=A0A8J4E5R6_9ACTN|nr:BTAD domain-containing putative transcriptional regulator [Virgisporangium aurantiacum]GIJ62606.1 SARP family transcriptional regulator [Virgisporangium aurantiacum]
MATEFRLLGEVQVHVDGQPVDLGHARQRFLLVALLVDANRPVPVDRLLDRVWGSGQPRHARNAVSGYVSRLRRILDGVATITRRPDGYLLAVDPDTVDMFVFRRLVGRSARPESLERERELERALALWRGEPFGTLDAPWLTGIRAALAAERLTAELDLVDAALAAGRHADLLGELATRAAAHPFDERIAGQLMTALYRCGRRADALRHYQEVRDRLVDELGMDPTAELGRLHQRILASDPALSPERPAAAPGDGAADGTAGRPVPRQLPAPPAVFTGREAALSRLDGLTSGAAVVSGCAGVGKSALAVYWAHRVAARFPDGQLYVNLRGFDPDGAVAAPAEVVRGFLDALGVSARRLPIDLAAQTALFRSLLAGRRVLVVLDNARDAAQVRPLLPGSPGCLTVVTSRNQLGGLVVVDHAEPVPLDLFTDAEARAFLTRRLGAGRIAGEPTAVAEIVRRCGRLPLALAVVAARAAAHPGFRLADVAAELGGGLDSFDGGDPHADVRAVFSWSYRALSPAGARLFRLLGLHPGPAFDTDAAASVAGMPAPAVRRSLTELTRAHLLTERASGRYVMHDLLHAYAAEQVEGAEKAAAAVRILDHYLHTAYAADRMLYPYRDPVVLSEPAAGVAVGALGDRAAAMTWLRTAHGTLVGAVEWAARTGHDRHCWELAWSLTSYFNLSGGWTDQVAVQRTALSAATRLGDDTALAHVHRNLGRAHTQLGRLDEARTHLDQALSLFRAVGDRANEAQTQVNVARVLERQGRDVEALHCDQRSLDLYRAAGHLTGQARALNNVAWMLTRLGDVDLARTLCREALRINEDIGNRHGAATNWQSIGHLELAAGAYRTAVDGCRRALDLFAEIDDLAGTADTLVCLGEAYHADGDPAAADDTWRRALTLLDEMGHPEADRVRGYLRPAPAAGAGRPA